MVELNNNSIDYAEQSGDLIVHFSSKREVVLLEILDASQFLKKTFKTLPTKLIQEIIPQSSIAHRIR